MSLANRVNRCDSERVENATDAGWWQVGWTPLHWAAAHGHYEVVRALVSEFGASVRAQTKHGETPLDVAKRLQQKEVAEFLKGVNW